MAVALYFPSLLLFFLQNQREISTYTSRRYQYQGDTRKRYVNKMKFGMLRGDRLLWEKYQIIKFKKDSKFWAAHHSEQWQTQIRVGT